MKRLLPLIIIALLSFNIHAQWQAIGPYGGYISCFATSDSSIFAGTNGDGIFLFNGSQNVWSSVSTGLPVNAYVTALAAGGKKIVAGIANYGVYLSTNNGTNWIAINNGLNISDGAVNSIAIIDSSIVISIATSSGGVSVNDSGVYGSYTFYNGILFKSTDLGNSWAAANPGLENGVNFLTVSGANIFASNSVGLFLSIDTGDNWTGINNGLPQLQGLQQGVPVICAAAKDSSIFAGTFGKGVFFSADNGTSWNPVNAGLGDNVISTLAIKDTMVYAATGKGLFLSRNNGNSWEPSDSGLANYPVYSLAVCDNNIFAGANLLGGDYIIGYGGVFLSVDEGNSWELVNRGITNTSISSIVANNAGLFAGARNGVFSLTNAGNGWNEVQGFPITSVVDVDVLSNNSGDLYSLGNGAYVSANNGVNWSKFNLGFGISSLAFNGFDTIVCTSNDSVYLSTDNGSNWQVVIGGLAAAEYVTAIAMNDSHIFVGSHYESSDFGGAIFNGGLYVLSYNGANWSVTDSTEIGASITALVVNGSTIFIGTDGGGVFLSTDNGKSWNPVNIELPPFAQISSLAVSGSTVFAGVQYASNGLQGGIFYSPDNGTSWVEFDSGMTCNLVNSLVINGSTLYACTFGGGVWQRSIAGYTGVREISGASNAGFNLYPNPAHNNFIIETNSIVQKSLQVFDITGQLLLSQPIADTKTAIDIGGFPSGLYLVSLQGTDGIVTKKLVVTR